MSSDTVIEVSDLSKAYLIYDKPQDRLKQMIVPRLRRVFGLGRRVYYKEHWALRNISFTVSRGESVGIIGRNGSGKSTLLQMICGTLSPSAGHAVTHGRIGALLELGAGFNPEFTGRQNAILNAQILGILDSEIAAKLCEIEAFADIGAFFDYPVKTYSSGMYVRVAFAVQACINPEILIIDEALAVGDEKFQRKCYDHLEELRSRGTSILLVTHSTTVIERFCQRAILLHKGEVHGIGRSNVIVDQYHALLYADESAYLQILNKDAQGTPSALPFPTIAREIPVDELARVDSNQVEGRTRAQIVSSRLTNAAGDHQEMFRPGDPACISMTVKCVEALDEVQAGLSIKTVEGVHGFGTSTLYYGNNCKNLAAGESVTIKFKVSLSLCEGIYFVSLAVAAPVSQAEMQYLDKRSDVIIFNVTEPRLKASGIAYLPTSIEIIRGA